MGRLKETLLVVWSIHLALLSAASFRWLRTAWPLKGAVSGMLAVGALLSLDVWRHRPADSSPWRNVWLSYQHLWWVRTVSRWHFWRWRYRQMKDPRQAQEHLLLRTLKDNADTEYGQQWELSKVTDRESFRALHPLTNYDHYRDVISRVAAGYPDVMTSDDVIFMALTSGTTGTNKMYPLTASYASLIGSSFSNIIVRYLPEIENFKRTWEFRMMSAPRKLLSGLPLGGASQLWGPPSTINVVPPCVYVLTQEAPCFYVQAIFVLSEPELGKIDAFSSNLLYSFFKFMERNIEQLCSDICHGVITPSEQLGIDIDMNIMKEITPHLEAKPGRASEIRREMANGIEGFAKRIWPDLEYVFLAKSGSFAHAYGILSKTYLEGVKVVTPAHGGTECFSGVNIDIDKPLEDVYTMVPDVCFLEFIPIEKVDDQKPETLFIDQLETGKCYEIVSTNRQGIYRYRVGDVIKIVGFYGSLPQYVFMYRLGQRLSVALERTPESHVYEAVERHVTSWPLGVALIDYTSTESVVIESLTGERSSDDCYVIFMEVTPESFKLAEVMGFQSAVDATLCDLHEPYKAYRQKGAISAVSIVQVGPGTFEKLKHVLWAGHQNQQFKMPRVERRAALLQILLDNRLF